MRLVAVQRSVANAVPELPGFDSKFVDGAAEAERLVRDGVVEAAALPNSAISADIAIGVGARTYSNSLSRTAAG